MRATCSVCGWSGFQGSWTAIRSPGPDATAPKRRIMRLLCFSCSVLWKSIEHQIDCDGCYQCVRGGQHNNEKQLYMASGNDLPLADFCERPPAPVATPFYPSLGDFYNGDRRRLRSGEADYGVHWRLKGWTHKWRVSYVHRTGEIYAVHQQMASNCTPGPYSYGPLFVIG